MIDLLKTCQSNKTQRAINQCTINDYSSKYKFLKFEIYQKHIVDKTCKNLIQTPSQKVSLGNNRQPKYREAKTKSNINLSQFRSTFKKTWNPNLHLSTQFENSIENQKYYTLLFEPLQNLQYL